MPSTYVTDSANACAFVTARLSPTMMPERIGIIGSTHGVNVRRTPAPKKSASVSRKLPDPKACSNRTSSPRIAGSPLTSRPPSWGVDICGAPPSGPLAAALAPSERPARLTSAFCVSGG